MSKAKVITKKGVFVRSEKSRSSDWVRIIPYGEEFEWTEEYGGWVKVEDGWVVASDVYIQPVEVTAGGALPFGEETLFCIEWDGNTEGLTCALGNIYKVSDEVPAYEDLIGATVYVANSSGTDAIALTEDNLINQDVVYGGEMFICVPEPFDMGDGVAVDEPGVYFVKSDDFCTTKLERTVVTTIDPKFVPNRNRVVNIEVDDNNVTSVDMTTEEIARLMVEGSVVIANIPAFGIFAPFTKISTTTQNKPYVFCRAFDTNTELVCVSGYYSYSSNSDVWDFSLIQFSEITS